MEESHGENVSVDILMEVMKKHLGFLRLHRVLKGNLALLDEVHQLLSKAVSNRNTEEYSDGEKAEREK